MLSAKDDETVLFAFATFCFRAGLFLRDSTPNGPVAFGARRKANSGKRAAA
jgi:hypothetical protein